MDKEYALGVFGLSGAQRMVLASLCRLSRNREVTYRLQAEYESRSGDIVIVGDDHEHARPRWEHAPSGTPVVHVSAQPMADLPEKHYRISPTQLSGGLLHLLNRISANEFGRSRNGRTFNGGDCSREFRREDIEATVAKALIIDDSLSCQTQIRLCLENYHITVSVAANGSEGIEKLRERPVDIVFLDVMLPDMDGYQVCKLIKKNPETRKIPVVMLTGKGSPINRLQGSFAGCDRYLVKPVAEGDVFNVSRHLLRIPLRRKAGWSQSAHRR